MLQIHTKVAFIVMCETTSGVLLPPYVVYRTVNLYRTWNEGGTTQTGYGRLINVWFYE